MRGGLARRTVRALVLSVAVTVALTACVGVRHRTVPARRTSALPAERIRAYLAGPAQGWTISGQHNREPLDDPTRWTRKVHDITGKYPGLWGGDLSFFAMGNRGRLIDTARQQWEAGSLVTLMWHMCPPTNPEPCGWDTPDGVWAKLTDDQWRELCTDGTTLNRAWLRELDDVVPLLKRLRDAGVGVLWRPLHEMNDDWAWWGGRPGPDGSQRLFRMMHDYFDRRGLDNLVWVWSVADRDIDRVGDYFPGTRYVDVAAMDIWQKPYPSIQDYDAMRAVAAGRPIALGEVSRVPTPAVLAAQPDWAWFMVWAEYLIDNNTESAVKAAYTDPHVLNRDRVEPRLRASPGAATSRPAVTRSSNG